MKKSEFCENFKGKKITMMGLGLLGRGLGVAKFLAECGAVLTVTDLKTKEALKTSLRKLEKFKNIKYVLGEHRLEDFRDRDMVIKAAGVPLDSPFIAEAKKNNIPVEMDASLFARLAKGVTIVGVTGTRGKSTVTHLLYEILDNAFSPCHSRGGGNPGLLCGKKVFLGGNVRGLATLPLLKKVREGDIVVMELDSWQLQGFGDAKMSPNVSLFTTFLPDHLNYYKGDMGKYFSDKANIFRYQTEEDVLLMRPGASEYVEKNFAEKIKSGKTVVGKELIPRGWKVNLSGEHNLENIALAISAARVLGAGEKVIKKTVSGFKGVPGRLEFIRSWKGIKFYNDTTATTPDGVIAAMDSLKDHKGKIILIGGGADKNLNYKEYAEMVPGFVKKFILFTGTATEKIKKEFAGKETRSSTSTIVEVELLAVGSMKEAVKNALAGAKKGDVILLSPGAASFGIFKNEFDRGDQFNKIVRKL